MNDPTEYRLTPRFLRKNCRVYLPTDATRTPKAGGSNAINAKIGSPHFDIRRPYSSLIPTNADITGVLVPAMFHFHLTRESE